MHCGRFPRKRLEYLVGRNAADDAALRSVLFGLHVPLRHFTRYLGVGPKLSRLLGLEAPGRSRDRGLFIRPKSKHLF